MFILSSLTKMAGSVPMETSLTSRTVTHKKG